MVGGSGEKILLKILKVGQKILILKRGSIMERVNFLKGLQGGFEEKKIA